MNMSTFIVLAVVIVIAALALKNSIGHFKGEGGCCGGGETILPDHKELDGPKIGEKTVHIEGMHCENCKRRVERAINRIDGAVGKVNLKKHENGKWLNYLAGVAVIIDELGNRRYVPIKGLDSAYM